ncbi:MAG: hypothetical protein ACHQ6U_06770 [Thermodesulfobacteriota bacterium]
MDRDIIMDITIADIIITATGIITTDTTDIITMEGLISQPASFSERL